MKARIGITVNTDFSPYSAAGLEPALKEYCLDKNKDTSVECFEKGMNYIHTGQPPNQFKTLVEEFFTNYDALVLPGNNAHIDPAFYSDDPKERETIILDTSDKRRNKLEIELTREAITRGVPILGVCGGLQIINVVLGGKIIYVDVDKEVKNSEAEVLYLTNTHLHGIIREIRDEKTALWHQEYSQHQQMLDPKTLPDILLKVATSQKEIIKGVELLGHHPWLIGLQFHPENFYNPDVNENNNKTLYPKQNAALFKDFLDSVRIVKQVKKHKKKMLEEMKGTTSPRKVTPKDSALHQLIEQFVANSKAGHDIQETRTLLKNKIRSIASANYLVDRLSSNNIDISLDSNLLENAVGNNVKKLRLLLKNKNLSEDQWKNIVNHFKSIVTITNGIELYEFLKILPDSKRYEIAIKHQSIIRNSKERNAILSVLPEEQRYTYFKITELKKSEFEDLIALLILFPKQAKQLIRDDSSTNKRFIKGNEIRILIDSGLSENVVSTLIDELKLITDANNFSEILNAMPEKRYEDLAKLINTETFNALVGNNIQIILNKLKAKDSFIQAFKSQLGFIPSSLALYSYLDPIRDKNLIVNIMMKDNNLTQLFDRQLKEDNGRFLETFGKNFIFMVQNAEQLKSLLHRVHEEKYPELASTFWENAGNQSTGKFLELIPILIPYLSQKHLDNISKMSESPNWSRRSIANLYQIIIETTTGEKKGEFIKKYAAFINTQEELKYALDKLTTVDAIDLFKLTNGHFVENKKDLEKLTFGFDLETKEFFYRAQEEYIRSLLKKDDIPWNEIGKKLKCIDKKNRNDFIEECAGLIKNKNQLSTFSKYLIKREERGILLKHLNRDIMNKDDIIDVLTKCDYNTEHIPGDLQFLYSSGFISSIGQVSSLNQGPSQEVYNLLKMRFNVKTLTEEMNKKYDDKDQIILQLKAVSHWLSTQRGIKNDKEEMLLFLLKDLCFLHSSWLNNEPKKIFNELAKVFINDESKLKFFLSQSKKFNDSDIKQITTENCHVIDFFLDKKMMQEVKLTKFEKK